MIDILDNLHASQGAFGDHADQVHGYLTFPKLTGELGPRMKFNGKEKIIWSLNNYLGLANHPEVRKVDAEASANYGLAYPMGSRIMSGHSDNHEQLENELAAYVGKESSILFNFGYPGVVSTIDALLRRQDVVIYDAESHACIMDGVRMHMGKKMSFKHNDMEHLEKQLQKAMKFAEDTNGGILVISEGVFSMRGDQGRLKEIVALKEKYPFRLFIDDAHGFGVLGKTGAGTGEEQGVQDGIDFYFSTFAKSMASVGAFLSANAHVIRFMHYNARSQVFAKALPMPLVVGGLKRLDLLRKNPQFRDKMWENALMLQNGLRERGLEIGTCESPITPVYLYCSLEEVTNVLLDLRENFNIFCSPVIYPVVPKGVVLFRLVPTAVHTKEDIETTIDVFEKVKDKIAAGAYKVKVSLPTK